MGGRLRPESLAGIARNMQEGFYIIKLNLGFEKFRSADTTYGIYGFCKNIMATRYSHN